MSVGRAYELLLGQCCVIVVDRVSCGRRAGGVSSVPSPGGRAKGRGRYTIARGRRRWSISQDPSPGGMSRRIFAIPFALFPSSRT
jgi:hypothetical protein